MNSTLQKSPDARSINRELNISEFRRGATELQSLPLAIIVELTQNCNLRCSYCYGQERKYNPDLNMPLPFFRRLAEELFPTAALVDLRGWGESTVLKSFSEFVSITASYGPQIRLVTNAMNSDKRIWEQLMRYHAQIAISCDTANPGLFSQLRVGGQLAQLLQTVRTIVHYRDQYNVPSDNVCFTTVVTQPSVERLSDLVQMAYTLGISKIVLFPVTIFLSHPYHLRNDIDATRKGLVAAYDSANKLGITLQLGASLDDSLRLAEDICSLCIHPWAYALIDYIGQVGFCDNLIGYSKYTFGSLFDKPFMKIWNGHEFRTLRSKHLQRNIPDQFSPCRYCYEMRYIDFEDLIYPFLEQKIVSNRTREKIYRNGIPITPPPGFG